jgi:GNAT superfamily N-acetyltransferase
MEIRAACDADLPAVVRMACQFICESSYRGLVTVNPAAQEQLARDCLEGGGLFVVDVAHRAVGVIGLALVVLPTTGELVALELIWWVDPGLRKGTAGVRLWEVAEEWARLSKAVWIQMIAPAGAELVERMYRRRGYQALETVFVKALAVAGGV